MVRARRGALPRELRRCAAGELGPPHRGDEGTSTRGRLAGAESDAGWALETGCAEAESPIGRYAACLALLVLGRDEEAGQLAATIQRRDDFPRDVADALRAIATDDAQAYERAACRCSRRSRLETTTSRTSRSLTRCSCCRRSRRPAGSPSSSAPICCRRSPQATRRVRRHLSRDLGDRDLDRIRRRTPRRALVGARRGAVFGAWVGATTGVDEVPPWFLGLRLRPLWCVGPRLRRLLRLRTRRRAL